MAPVHKALVFAASLFLTSSAALTQAVVPLSCLPGDSRFNAQVFFRVISLPTSFCNPGSVELQYGVEWTDPSPGVEGFYTVCGVDLGCPQGRCPWCAGGIEGTRLEKGSTIPVCPPVYDAINNRFLKMFTDITITKSDGTTTQGPCTPGEFPREFCGDGHVNASAGEQCDDGNTSYQDCCSPTCQLPEHGVKKSLISWDMMEDYTCDLFSRGDRKTVQDGAFNAVNNKCILFPENQFELTFTSKSGSCVKVGKCLWQNGRNEGWAVFSPTQGSRCITDVYWMSVEYGGTSEGTPGEIDWRDYHYDALSDKLTVRDCHDINGPGHNDDNCSEIQPNDVSCTAGSREDLTNEQAKILPISSSTKVMGAATIAVCDNDRDGDCDATDLALAFASIGGCQGTGGYNQPVDLDSDGCVSSEDFEHYRSTFPDCMDGMDNDGDGLVDFPADTGCLSVTDSIEQALQPISPIISVWIPTNSTELNAYPAVDEVWKSVVPPFPLNASQGIGNIIRDDISLNRFVLHDHVYVSPNIPDPKRAQITYEFDRPVTVNQVEIIQHANGITKIEAFVGDTLASLTSIGSYYGPLGDVTGPSIFPEGGSYLFDFNNNVAGRVFRFVIRKTSLDNGYALYRAFLKDAAGERIRAATLTECNDGHDNDSDGLVDFPGDPGCSDKGDNRESFEGTISNLVSTSHVVNVYSSDRTIDVSWAVTTDNPLGVLGYSVQFDNAAASACDQDQDTVSTSATSGSLTDGDWYVHVCAVDHTGIWGAVASAGPFRIDATGPAAVSGLASSSHVVNVYSSDRTVDVSWTSAVDALSGVVGYAYQFDSNVSWVCDQVQDGAGTGATSGLLTDGVWYFHVCAVDAAGNWGPVAHLGPFLIDDTGTLIIVQDTVPNGPQDFLYSGIAAFALDDDADTTLSNTISLTLVPGAYSITQGAGVGAFVLAGLNCTDPSGGTSINISTRTATVGLALGETITCVFANTQKGMIRIVQDTVPNRPTDFTFAGDLGNFSLDDDADGALTNSAEFAVQSGVYSVSQAPNNGFSLALSCTDPSGGTTIGPGFGTAHISIAAGETVICTFQNTVQPGFDYFTVTPCRVLDTRQTTDGPALSHGIVRTVMLHGSCGIPTTASAVAVNITITGPTGAGYVALYPSNQPIPGTSTINFLTGQTRANNSILQLATDGSGAVNAISAIAGAGRVHLIIDVVGYFRLSSLP